MWITYKTSCIILPSSWTLDLIKIICNHSIAFVYIIYTLDIVYSLVLEIGELELMRQYVCTYVWDSIFIDFNNIQLTKIVYLPYLYFIQCLGRCSYGSEATAWPAQSYSAGLLPIQVPGYVLVAIQQDSQQETQGHQQAGSELLLWGKLDCSLNGALICDNYKM